MSDDYLGEIRIFSFIFPPRGWALCNGQLLPINQNQALFAILGTTFGGDGRVNFALPNFQGRMPIHVGAADPQSTAYVLGQRGGTVGEGLTEAHIRHAHVATGVTGPRVGTAPSGTTMLASGDMYGNGPPVGGALNPSAISTTQWGGGLHLNMQPTLTLSICICLQGIFPSPN
jgi:microcystin-dependent protein